MALSKKYGIKVSIMVSDKNTALNKVLAEKDGKGRVSMSWGCREILLMR